MVVDVDNERMLLNPIAQGNTEAFSVIFNRYQDKIFTFCAHILQSDMLAEEVVQEVIVKLP
ncbi:MAG TPA: hypothetical protein PKA53_01720 [Sphingobacterium sp.]|nr:hypothetical protein [Sphingobacterium sp.]